MTGRPSIRTPELAQQIFEWIASGKSLAKFCREHDIGYQTVLDWRNEDETFSGNYERAREDAGDADADIVTDIRERCIAGEIEPNAARVAMDAAKWTAGVRKPKKYGPKLDVTSGGEAVAKDSTALAVQVASLLAAGAARAVLAGNAGSD